MATYIDNIVKFHTFSKSPVSKDTTLGGAVNPSGHTVTTSQVRAQDIPAFLNTFQGTKEQAITWLGTNYPTPAHNDIVFYGGEFKAGFSTPKCLKWNAKLETPAWEDFDITTAATLKNADDKDVIAVHQNCTTVFVDGSNNAATNSNRNSLFVKRADGSILDHFVASTDKIVAGMPSLGYNALVLWNGGAIDEGELEANYIGNTFAGIVHLNKQYSTGDDAKFKVTCFEYIGEKLDTSITELAKKVESVTATAGEGVQAVTDVAATAGLSVSTKEITVEGQTDPVTVKALDIDVAEVSAEGVVTTGDGTKLVTATGSQNIANKAITDAVADGSVIDTRIDEVITAATLTTPEGSSDAIKDTSDTSKLVTAEQVKTYVTNNAQVTVTVGETEQATTNLEFAGSTGDDVTITATPDTADGYKVTFGATIDKATVKDGVVDTTTGNGDKVISATNAAAIAAKALEDAKAYSDSLHSTNLVYIVLGDNETLPEPSANTVGKIYLVKEGNTANGEPDIDAISGSYVEYMTRQVSETEYTWEKIGTTAADLSGYVNSIANANGVSGTVTGNVATITVQDGNTTQKGIVQLASSHEASDTDKAATGATVAAAISGITQTDASDNGVKVITEGGSVTGVEVTTTSIVSNDALVESVTDDNLITAADALAAIKLAKPENYVASVTGYTTTGAEVTTTQGATIKVSDGRENVYANDLWGTTVNIDDNGVITVQSDSIDGTLWVPKNGYNTKGDATIDGTVYPQSSNPITKVQNNMVYNGTTEVANIKTNKLVNGNFMFYQSTLASFSGDLSSLVDGNYMFYQSSLNQFSGDLRSLVNGFGMFKGTSINQFHGDLSSLVNGIQMFEHASLNQFSGDLSSLVNGTNMFSYTSLASFNGDLSSLVSGFDMFKGTSLASFSGDLSSLVNGFGMFRGTSLASFSGDLSSLENGGEMFYQSTLASFSGDLSSLVNGQYMFSFTSLASFSGDLSSLENGGEMFSHTPLTSFTSDLSSLVSGSNMFVETSLDVESVELICDVLPNYNIKKLQTAKWNSSGENKGKYTYSDWSSGNYYYPIIKIINNESMSQGNADGFNRSFGTDYIEESNVKTITIYWNDISVLSEADRAAIAELFANTAREKGWTFIVNAEIAESGEIAPTNAVMAADGTIQYYVLAKKDEATEDNATHIDASGKLWKFDIAEAIIGPNIKYWSMFATVEDALTEWELTPWTKPIEEETEA